MSRHILTLLENSASRSMIKDICKSKGIRFAEFEELVHAGVDLAKAEEHSASWATFDDILENIQEE